jgi:hypothetical protein
VGVFASDGIGVLGLMKRRMLPSFTHIPPPYVRATRYNPKHLVKLLRESMLKFFPPRANLATRSLARANNHFNAIPFMKAIPAYQKNENNQTPTEREEKCFNFL